MNFIKEVIKNNYEWLIPMGFLFITTIWSIIKKPSKKTELVEVLEKIPIWINEAESTQKDGNSKKQIVINKAINLLSKNLGLTIDKTNEIYLESINNCIESCINCIERTHNKSKM